MTLGAEETVLVPRAVRDSHHKPCQRGKLLHVEINDFVCLDIFVRICNIQLIRIPEARGLPVHSALSTYEIIKSEL